MEFYIEKNDIVELTIEDISEAGEGIGKADGYTLFIKDALPGDRVRAKVTKAGEKYGYARLMQIISPSPDRVQPRCPVAAPCGGCQLQALSYDRQLAFKERRVRDVLERIGGFTDPPVCPVTGMEEPYAYRNKEQFPVARSRDGRIITGFYAGRTHSIIETPHCFLGDDINEYIMNLIISWMNEYDVSPYDEESCTGLIRHVLIRTGGEISPSLPGQEDLCGTSEKPFSCRQLMVCLVINGQHLPCADELVHCLVQIPGMTSVSCNINTKRTNVILGSEMFNLYGDGYITDTIGELRYRVSAQSFYQVNRTQTVRLYSRILEYADLTGEEVVWDLYCGIGTITLFLAGKARTVYGVEVVPAAVADARANAAANGIDNAIFYLGRAEETAPRLYSETGERPDVIVVDPPRKGCDAALLETILQMSPSRVIYVSCNPSTMARDLKILCEDGYRLCQVQPVDMFPQTVGVECVVLLTGPAADPEKDLQKG